MISAAVIKPILDASTHVAPDHFLHNGLDRYPASVDGVWQSSPESDLFHIDEETFVAVQGATANPANGGATLLIDSVEHELTGTRIAGVRWCILSEV